MDSVDKYNPHRVIQEANERLQNAGASWVGAEQVFQSALLEWSDDAREMSMGQSQSPHVYETLREALATLYIAYAQFLAQHHQYKSSMEAYENATSDSTVRNMGRLWLEYAAYCQDRQKFVLAQQVYLRALVGSTEQLPAVTDEQECTILWDSFWEMVKEQTNNPDMTLEELQAAVEVAPPTSSAADAVVSSSSAFPLPLTSMGSGVTETMDDEPTMKRIKREDGDVTTDITGSTPMAISSTGTTSISNVSGGGLTHVVTPEAVQQVHDVFLPLLEQPEVPAEIKAAWLILDGTGTAQPPEPPLFGVSPPKLSDPSGKDLLGVPLALALTQLLLQGDGSHGNLLLCVCRALWVMTAVNERDVADRIDKLDAELQTVVAQKETDFASQLAVVQPAHKASVQLNVEQQRQALHTHCGKERTNLLHELAWQSRRLLCAQQMILQKLNVPAFESGPTIDRDTLDWHAKVCTYLHSAFYLRQRIGEATHVSMLQKQCKKLEKEQEELDAQQQQQQQQQQQHEAASSSTLPPLPSHLPPPPPPPQSHSNTMYGYGMPPPAGAGYYNVAPPPPISYGPGGPVYMPHLQQPQQQVPSSNQAAFPQGQPPPHGSSYPYYQG
jgi:hypothetical protein